MMQTKQWFLERIGKTVYRDIQPHDNMFARKLGRATITIKDEYHAQYMFDVQNDLMADNGINLNYRDTKEK